MSKTLSNALRAATKRAELIRVLGERCVWCGSQAHLELHHPYGRDWAPRRHNRWTRVNKYWRDFEAGNLELLCQKCNGQDGAFRNGKA